MAQIPRSASSRPSKQTRDLRDQKIINDCRAGIAAGRFVCKEYAHANGYTVGLVEAVTRRTRTDFGMVKHLPSTLPRETCEAIYRNYVTLREARRWRVEMERDLAVLHGVPDRDVRNVIKNGSRRYGSAADGDAIALLRDLAAARENASKEAAE